MLYYISKWQNHLCKKIIFNVKKKVHIHVFVTFNNNFIIKYFFVFFYLFILYKLQNNSVIKSYI